MKRSEIDLDSRQTMICCGHSPCMPPPGICGRQINYDFLRAVSCISVVILHIASLYQVADLKNIVNDKMFLAASIFRVITQMGVPCFVMLSGAFLLKNAKNAEYHYFYAKSVKKIGIPILVFSILYVMMYYAKYMLFGELKKNYSFSFWNPLVEWLKGAPHPIMWYMYMIIPLYMVVPFIVRIKSGFSKKEWYVIALIMMLYSMLVSYTCSLSWILRFVEWIGYFMMGDVISDLAANKIDLKISRFPLLCIAFSYGMLLVYWFCTMYQTMELSVPSSLSPVCVVSSILLFTGFANLRIKDYGYVRIISKYSFYIYLIHPIICELAGGLFGRILKWFPPAELIPVYTVLITALSMAITVIAFKIINLCVQKK